jgi:hypothetical protein
MTSLIRILVVATDRCVGSEEYAHVQSDKHTNEETTKWQSEEPS